MNKVLVRCWRLEQIRPGTVQPDHLFITYPEGADGHSLITCLRCGALCAVTVTKEIYVGPPLAEKLRDLPCAKCGAVLGGNWAFYPETYLANGQVYAADRPATIPPDDESIVMEFDGVYE